MSEPTPPETLAQAGFGMRDDDEWVGAEITFVLDSTAGRFAPRMPVRSIFDDADNAARWDMLRQVLTSHGYRQQITRVQRWKRDEGQRRMHQDYRRRQIARRRRRRRA